MYMTCEVSNPEKSTDSSNPKSLKSAPHSAGAMTMPPCVPLDEDDPLHDRLVSLPWRHAGRFEALTRIHGEGTLVIDIPSATAPNAICRQRSLHHRRCAVVAIRGSKRRSRHSPIVNASVRRAIRTPLPLRMKHLQEATARSGPLTKDAKKATLSLTSFNGIASVLSPARATSRQRTCHQSNAKMAKV